MTNAQKKFCDEYLIDLNATRAYKVAYPNVKKDETINAAASRLLRNVKVKEYIDEQMKQRGERTKITQDMVLNELAAIAFSNATDFAKIENGRVIIKDTDKLNSKTKKAIEAIKEGKNGIEVKMADKKGALELIGKHLGMFKDKLEISKITEETAKDIDDYINSKRAEEYESGG